MEIRCVLLHQANLQHIREPLVRAVTHKQVLWCQCRLSVLHESGVSSVADRLAVELLGGGVCHSLGNVDLRDGHVVAERVLLTLRLLDLLDLQLVLLQLLQIDRALPSQRQDVLLRLLLVQLPDLQLDLDILSLEL